MDVRYAKIADASMADQALRLRNHPFPCVVVWSLRSDNPASRGRRENVPGILHDTECRILSVFIGERSSATVYWNSGVK